MSDQPDLFEVPEVLSPRLKWMREHGVRTHENNGAWFAEAPCLLPIGRGATEAEAVEDLAGRLGFVNYERAAP